MRNSPSIRGPFEKHPISSATYAKSAENHPKLIIFDLFPDFALSSRRRMCGWNSTQRIDPLDSGTSMSELLESEVWGPECHVRRYSIFSKFDDPKWVEKTRSEKKVRNFPGERFSRGRNERVPPTHFGCRRVQEV